jgi:glyoxylase-like metal-dependent hydrolase (beta-lactamase superfamily II)
VFDFIKGAIKFIRGGKYPFCNSVLIDDRNRAIIDASSDGDKLQQFKDQRIVDYLITSHAHEDHLVFNYLFPESRFCVHSLDAPQFEDVDSLIDSYGEMAQEDREKWRAFLKNDCHYTPRRADLLLEDGMVITFGEVRMKVIHTPGHTRGHCAFYFVDQRILFTADLDLTKAGPYYGDRASDIDETIRSLERLKTFEVKNYLTGHGKGVLEGNPEYIDRYLEIISSREEKLIHVLSKGAKTLDQVVQEGIIYGNKPPVGPWDLMLSERAMIIKHLSRLVSTNRVEQEGGFYVLRNERAT